MKKVVVFGTFDGIHKGHLDYFRQARQHGNYLIAIVARDITVEHMKGKKPKYNEQERLKEVQKYVDEAILGNITNKTQTVINLMPDVICLGYDQNDLNIEHELKKKNLSIKIVRCKSYKPEIYKSSKLNPE